MFFGVNCTLIGLIFWWGCVGEFSIISNFYFDILFYTVEYNARSVTDIHYSFHCVTDIMNYTKWSLSLCKAVYCLLIFFLSCYLQTVVFETPVFHPLIDPETLELDIKRGFANKWRRNVNHLWHVLLYVRRCFYKIETTHPLNPEAAVL